MTEVHTVATNSGNDYAFYAQSLNNHGVAAGEQQIEDNRFTAFRWDTHTDQVTYLPSPGPPWQRLLFPKINDSNGVAANGQTSTIYWNASGLPTEILSRDADGDVRPGLAAGLNNLGELVGRALVDHDGDGVYSNEVPFKHLIGIEQTFELPILPDANRGEATAINNSGMVGGWSNVPRPQYPGELREAPCYWDPLGGIHDLRTVLPWQVVSIDPPQVNTGMVLDVADDGTLLIYGHAGNTTFWVFNPATDTEAHYLPTVVPASGEPWTSLYGTSMSDNGTIVGYANRPDPDIGWRAVPVLYVPYTVTTTQISIGSHQTASVNGGTSTLGGTEITFEEVVSPGTVTGHYGQGPASDFASTFLSDPAALVAVEDMLLPGDFQYWFLDLEMGQFAGLVTLTFAYDPALLPPELDPARLMILHYRSDAWESLLPIASDPVAHTITVQTDSLSPFLLARVPEPASIVCLIVGWIGGALLRRSTS